jgi:hypothetical protein
VIDVARSYCPTCNRTLSPPRFFGFQIGDLHQERQGGSALRVVSRHAGSIVNAVL